MKSTKTFLFLLQIIFIFNFISCQNKQPLFKCEHKNDEGINALPTRAAPKQIKDQRRRIETDSEGFKDFNIYLDTKNIIKNIQDNHLEDYQDFFIESLNNVINSIKSLLKVNLYKMIII